VSKALFLFSHTYRCPPTIILCCRSGTCRRVKVFEQRRDEIVMSKTSLVVRCSRHLGKLRRWFPRVGTPQDGVARLSDMVPPRARIICAFPSWFVSITRPYDLPGRSEGKLCAHGSAGGPVGTWPTLWRPCPLTLWVSRWCPSRPP
jgi:hypothetical protein